MWVRVYLVTDTKLVGVAWMAVASGGISALIPQCPRTLS